MKTIEPFKVCNGLASVLVNIESQLKTNPNITIKEFCDNQHNHPLNILYSAGFNALITFAALVPLKEGLDHKDCDKKKWRTLRTARNALCHGSYTFLDDGSIEFVDREKKELLTPSEIINLSNKAYLIYTEKHSNNGTQAETK